MKSAIRIKIFIEHKYTTFISLSTPIIANIFCSIKYLEISVLRSANRCLGKGVL